MTAEQHKIAIQDLMQIPGISRAIADDLVLIGIKKITDLKDKRAERLYNQCNKLAGKTQCKTLLTTLENAVKYASDEHVHTQETKV